MQITSARILSSTKTASAKRPDRYGYGLVLFTDELRPLWLYPLWFTPSAAFRRPKPGPWPMATRSSRCSGILPKTPCAPCRKKEASSRFLWSNAIRTGDQLCRHGTGNSSAANGENLRAVSVKLRRRHGPGARHRLPDRAGA